MNREVLIALAIWVVVVSFGVLVTQNCDAGIDETSVSVSVLQLPGSTGWGLLAATPYDLGAIDGHATLKVQAAGSVIRGSYHVEAEKDIGAWAIVVFQDADFRGTQLDALSRDAKAGVGMDTPPIDVGEFHIEGRIAIAGRNSDQWGAPTAYDVLRDNDFDEAELEQHAVLQEIRQAPQGLNLPPKSSLVFLWQTTWQHPSGFSMPIQLMPEASTSDDAWHQLKASPYMSWEIGEKFSLEGRIDVVVARHKGEFQHEVASYFGAKVSFKL